MLTTVSKIDIDINIKIDIEINIDIDIVTEKDNKFRFCEEKFQLGMRS